MKIVIAGANGYIGSRLVALLVAEGHEVVALVRKNSPFLLLPGSKGTLSQIQVDFLNILSLENIPHEVDAAYYLIHSMGQKDKPFEALEKETAENFVHWANSINLKQIIYLGGLTTKKKLSPHMASRKRVEEILKSAKAPVTVLRSSIIIGSGSASFEIIRSLVEKLPLMVAPKWISNRCQPISVYDVLFYLKKVVGHSDCFNKTFDIGGPKILTYNEVLKKYAKVRKLKRSILIVPLLTPRLSSYWLYLFSPVNFDLGKNLVESLINESFCEESSIQTLFPKELVDYSTSVERAFIKVEQNEVISNWPEIINEEPFSSVLEEVLEIPHYGCLQEVITTPLTSSSEIVKENLWKMGGNKGWYFAPWTWKIRGWGDKIFGGKGFQLYRNDEPLKTGHRVDFWNVIVADHDEGRLLLTSNMKGPGEAWLEWKINKEANTLKQTASFRPKGMFGYLYWAVLIPIHKWMFKGMAKQISK